jgi:putative transposase
VSVAAKIQEFPYLEPAMPRRARLVLEGVPLHIVQRGHNRQLCFKRDADYVQYIDWLAEYAKAAGCAIHAYVLMSNHVHLLASFSDAAGPALLMKGLGQRYAQYFNWWYERTGAVWEGRYHSSLVAEDVYLMTCHQYVELNPVRAGMVSTPQEYRWSSYRRNAGLLDDALLTPHVLHAGLGLCAEERQRKYRELSMAAIDPVTLEKIREAIRSNRAIGCAPGKKGRPRKLER